MPHSGPRMYDGIYLGGVLLVSLGYTAFSVLCPRYRVIQVNSQLTISADSVRYLPTMIATIFTFLNPVIGSWLAFYFLKDPFPRHEQVAGAVSLIGVLVVALPYGDSETEPLVNNSSLAFTNITSSNFTSSDFTNSTCTLQSGSSCVPSMSKSSRSLAMAIAIFGVVGASIAYTFIRKIGNQVHSLIIVNYLSDMATLFSLVILLLGKGIQSPSSIVQGCYLVGLGIYGLASQFFLTMGFQEDKTSAAAIMIYTQLLFAMGFDWLLWAITPGWMSLTGFVIIFGSAIFVAIRKIRGNISATRMGKATDEEGQEFINESASCEMGQFSSSSTVGSK